MEKEIRTPPWPDWKDRQIELLDKAEFFDFSKHGVTAEWLRLLAVKVQSETSQRMLQLYLNETLQAWRLESIGTDALKRVKVDLIVGIIFSSVAKGKLDEKIEIVLPILRELRKNFDNLSPLLKAFAPFKRDKDQKMRFYGMCYHYPLFAEGVLDESLRLLLLLIFSVRDNPTSVEELNKLTLKQLKDELVNQGVSEEFFQGWNNRIRNSIAHARFTYDDKAERMHFQDIDYYGNLPPFSKWFNVEQFGRLESQLSDVYGITQDVIFMLRIQQLVVGPFVPRLAEDLLMPDIRKAISEGLLEDPWDP
jgi:hypothetical protein